VKSDKTIKETDVLIRSSVAVGGVEVRVEQVASVGMGENPRERLRTDTAVPGAGDKGAGPGSLPNPPKSTDG
jgi:hypothetical protein